MRTCELPADDTNGSMEVAAFWLTNWMCRSYDLVRQCWLMAAHAHMMLTGLESFDSG